MMNTPDFPTPGDYHDPELAPLADTLRAVVDAGKARALALEIVRLCLCAMHAPPAPFGKWLADGVHALTLWYLRARDIESGEEQKRHPAERLTLLDVAGAADRIASIANQRRKPGAWHGEAAIVYDLATALRRACGCDNVKADEVAILGAIAFSESEEEHWEMLRDRHDHTARTLLPLLVRDVREMLREARVDAGEIEAAIVAHGGTPS